MRVCEVGVKWFVCSIRFVAVISGGADDYISLTNIARYKDSKRTDYIIQNWLRNRNTIEFLGIWEQLSRISIPSNSMGLETRPG